MFSKAPILLENPAAATLLHQASCSNSLLPQWPPSKVFFQESEPVSAGIHIPFLCLAVCQVLWVQWCSRGWQQSRSTLSCSMFSSWYALPTPLQPSYWQREELSPGRCPQNHDQCCKPSFNCFYLFTPHYILFYFWVFVWICWVRALHEYFPLHAFVVFKAY